MIISSRQAKFGASTVPRIEHYDGKIVLSKKWIYIKNALVKSLKEKFDYGKDICDDCVSQTLYFLIELGAISEPVRKITRIKLWKKWIELSPLYEGINMQINTMLVKHHYPKMYENMCKDRSVYSHWGLTVVKEYSVYTLEFLQKNNMLMNPDDLLKRENVIKWIDDAIEKNKGKTEILKSTESKNEI